MERKRYLIKLESGRVIECDNLDDLAAVAELFGVKWQGLAGVRGAA